jgi:hypothetical protein
VATIDAPDSRDRRAALIGVKLAALVREHGGDPTDVAGFGGGAGAMVGGAAWVLLDDRPDDRLGAALAWAVRHDATSVHVLADRGTGQLARRAAAFTMPIEVSHVEGRALVPAILEPLPAATDAAEVHRSFRADIVAAGADPGEEHGIVFGEVRGLEVCRVVDDPDTGAARLEVGVGAHDREIFQMLHGDRPTIDALADVVSSVSELRAPGMPPHPLNRLGASRALRATLIERPHLIGASAVRAAAPPLPRPNLKDELPCVAIADIDGTATLVVCTSGVDLEVVPFTVDAIAAHHPLSERGCLIVAPARDVIDIQRRLAALVTVPTRFVALEPAALVAP